jgi:hypothetical protein
MNDERNAISNQINDIEYKINLIFEEQARLRENLNALKDSKTEKALRDKYIQKFDDRETELEGLQKQKETTKLKLQTIDSQISQLDQDWMTLRAQKIKEKTLQEKQIEAEKQKKPKTTTNKGDA